MTRPLLITDCDEVLLNMIAHFAEWLDEAHDLSFDLYTDSFQKAIRTRGGDPLAEEKIWPLLDGFRGRPKADVEALVDAIVAFSDMAARLGERLLEAEINPVFVLPQGQGVRAADGVVVLA